MKQTFKNKTLIMNGSLMPSFLLTPLLATSIVVTSLFTLSGCGGGGAEDSPTTEPMTSNQAYEMSRGQVIAKTTPTAELEVVVNLQTGVTQAALISGEAELTTP